MATIDPRVLAGIDKIDAGFAVFDERLCLVFCNARYPEIRGYPPSLCRPGTPLGELFRFNAVRGDYGPGDVEQQVAGRIEQLRTSLPIEVDQALSDGRVLLSRYKPIDGGGLTATYEDVTELRRAAEALRNDQMRYELVSEAVSEGIYDWNIEQNRLAVSDRLNQIFDFEQGELTAADWVARVHPADQAGYSAALLAHFKRQTPVLAAAYRIRDKTGGFRWIEDHGKAIRNAAGRAVRLVGAIADVTARKESERALQESEQRYALAMGAINEGVYDFDLVSNRVFYSPSVHTTLGFAPDNMSTPEDWLNRIHPEDLPRYRSAMADHLRGNTPRFLCEVRFFHSDGTLHWARQHGAAVRDASGRAIRVVGSTGDITAEKLLQQELDKARLRLSESLESIAQGFALFDADDRLVMSNAPYRHFFGGDLDPELGEMLVPGMKFEDYVRAAFRKGFYPDAGADLEAFVRGRLKQRQAGGTFELRLSDGTWLAVTERRTHDSGLVALYTDITDVKRREVELQAARDRAEAALRELQDAKDRLVQTEKLASLGQLTAGIAHEIKNPLNFVNNFAELSVELLDELRDTTAPVLARLADDKRAEVEETLALLTSNLSKITEHGKRADGIVKSMLAHSRGGAGDWQATDINHLVEQALTLAFHGARAQDKDFDVILERDFTPEAEPLDLVPQEITRVFLNLFANGFYAARKRRALAEPGFRPVVRVATRDLGSAVEVRVRDNGTGIPAELRGKLFQPFFTTKPTGEGTGLGLSISHDIVTQLHGGTIDVDSEPGAYTEFTVRLPRTAKAAQ